MNRRISPTLTSGLACALALSLSLVAACDDSGEARKDEAPVGPDGKAVETKPNLPGDGKIANPPALTKYKSPAEAIGAYNKCYSDCFTAGSNATNRETCKLDCDTLVETGMDTLKDEASRATYKTTWTTLRTCINGCWGDRKLNATNRATCLLTCQDAAEVAALPPPEAQTPTPGTAITPPAGGTAPGLMPVPTKTAPAPTPTMPTTPTKTGPATGTSTPPATGTTPAGKK